jgi:protein-S-isoprenylcysteine O-methyltransferase Ste14
MNISVFTVAYLVWAVSEIVLNRRMRSRDGDKSGADGYSLRLIWIVIAVSIGLGTWISMTFHRPIAAGTVLPYAGLVLIFTGVIFRLIIIRSLGRFFTVDVTIRPDHRLKKDGFYRFLRHPSYFASYLSFIGFGLSLNNWISLLLIGVSIFAAFAYRIKIEEQVLLDHFGTEYAHYQKTTKKLIPFLY